MKSVIRIPFLMGGAALAFLLNYELSQHYFAFPEEEEDGIEAAMEQERQLTEDPTLHRIPKERLLPAAEYRTQRVQTAEMMNLPVSGLNWTERGPSNIGGRTRAILFDLNDAPNYRKIWAGGVGGGLWYTNDITVSAPQWNKVNDLLDNLAISCIAQSSVTKNVLYFGTGEGWYNSDAQQGLGIWKSSDGGASWSQLASTNNSIFYYVQKMVVDDQNNVFACTRSGGVQKSSDGGATWTKVLGSGVNGGVHNAAADIELAPNGDLYCSLGILNTGKIYRSADRGVTWTDISPATLSAQRIELATSAGLSDVLYALAQGSGSYDCNSIQRYQVSTNTWTNCSVPTIIDQGSNSP
ncbi:MAG: WD40/YVTN/BNR-like repeat-containing protein, partial [Chitinophagaceae bacterium]